MNKKILLVILVSIPLFLEINGDDKKYSIYGLPIVMYSPETRFAGGAMGNLLWKTKEEYTNSNFMMLSGIYSQNRQSSLQLITDLVFCNEKVFTHSFLGFSEFPDSFFGIGNDISEDNEESYTPQNLDLELTIGRKLRYNMFFALRLEYLNSKMKKIAENGLLAGGEITGIDGGRTSAAGVSFGYDSRDNCFFAQNGSYFNFDYLNYEKLIGSDYQFDKITVDLRHYKAVNQNQAVGTQLYFEGLEGNIPFYQLAKLGGMEKMRGYFEGQYRDKKYLAWQIDYRIHPVIWRFGIVFFAGAGQVAGEVKGFSVEKTRISGGFGVRYQLNEEENFNIRLDFGIGKNSTGMYLTASEAF